jgi:hypothetical protein
MGRQVACVVVVTVMVLVVSSQSQSSLPYESLYTPNHVFSCPTFTALFSLLQSGMNNLAIPR